VDHTNLGNAKNVTERPCVVRGVCKPWRRCKGARYYTVVDPDKYPDATRSASPELHHRNRGRTAPEDRGRVNPWGRALPRRGRTSILKGLTASAAAFLGAIVNAFRTQSSEKLTSKNVGEAAKTFDAMGSNDVFHLVSAIRRPFEMNLNDETTRSGDPECRYAENLLHLSAIRKRAYQAPGLLCRHRGRNSENFKATLVFGSVKEEKDAYAVTWFHPGRTCSLDSFAGCSRGKSVM